MQAEQLGNAGYLVKVRYGPGALVKSFVAPANLLSVATVMRLFPDLRCAEHDRPLF